LLEWNGRGWGREAARMTIATIDTAPTAVPTELARGRGGGGPAPKRIVVAYGFWIFILSDFVLFSGLFAAYAVLSGNTAGGPSGAELFNLRNVFIETMCLLFSSYTCGLGALSAERRQPLRFLVFAALTFVLGAAFLFIEATEFAAMVDKGAGPERSAFLSGFFTLVGTHGVHVTSGLFWLLYLVAQVIAKGLRPAVLRRLLCWSLFWHALDIVWVGVFTLVYLMGDFH
jgi:cytochrome o ubiquinol oxidase subunit III